jgi:hypothetical protein
MPKSNREYLLFAMLTSVVVCSPFALGLDYSKFRFGIPDIVYMISPSFWAFFFAVCGLLFVSVAVSPGWFRRTLLVVSCVPFVAFPLGQWPLILGWDQYSHAAIAKEFALGFGVAGEYQGYPGAFMLLNSSAVVQGLDLIVSGSLLAVMLRILALVMIYLIATNTVGRDGAHLTVFLFVLGNMVFDIYTYYCAQLFGFTMYLVCIYMYVKSRSRACLVGSLFVAGILVVSHPFSSLMMALTFAGIYCVQLIARRRDLNVRAGLIFLVAVGWLSWQIYASLFVTQVEIGQVIDAITHGIRFFDIVVPSLTTDQSVYSSALVAYRKIVHIVIGGMAAVGLVQTVKTKQTQFLLALLLAVLMLSSMFFVIAAPPRDTWLARTILFGYVPASALATVFVFKYMSKGRLLRTLARRPRISHCMGRALPIMFTALILLSFFSTYQMEYSDTIHPWETTPVSFLAASNSGHRDVTGDDVTVAAINRYLQKGGAPTTGGINRYSGKPEDLDQHSRGTFVIRSYRQEVQWYYSQGVAPQEWYRLDRSVFTAQPSFNRAYDNSYVQIYDGTET